jgi:hypothetical protein
MIPDESAPISAPNANSIWFNKEKLEAVKAPPVPSVLVVTKMNEVDKDRHNIDVVEKAILDNRSHTQTKAENLS